VTHVGYDFFLSNTIDFFLKKAQRIQTVPDRDFSYHAFPRHRHLRPAAFLLNHSRDTQPGSSFFLAIDDACLPSALRTDFGRWAIVRLLFAAAAAFFVFLRAAVFCCLDDMLFSFSNLDSNSDSVRRFDAVGVRLASGKMTSSALRTNGSNDRCSRRTKIEIWIASRERNSASSSDRVV